MHTHDQTIIGGKYEIAVVIQSKEIVQEYLEVCIEEVQACIERQYLSVAMEFEKMSLIVAFLLKLLIWPISGKTLNFV